jgi:hypothetical protein
LFESEREWRRAIEQTWVARFPKQHLATFGSTNISYYVVTEPIYLDAQPEKPEGVVRTGRVIAERPAIVTPTYAMNLQGFSSEAYEYFQSVAMQAGPNSPGLLYQYKNETGNTEIVSGAASEIANKISGNLERKKEDMSVVMVGVDEAWDVALLKFIYEFTSSSVAGNVQEMAGRGMLEPQAGFGGVPRAAIDAIERMFVEVGQGANPEILKRELDRWGLFEFFEERFLNMFMKR